MFTDPGVPSHDRSGQEYRRPTSYYGMDAPYDSDTREEEDERNRRYIPGLLLIAFGSLLWVTFMEPLIGILRRVFRLPQKP